MRRTARAARSPKRHARRKFFELADVASKSRNRKTAAISPIAFEAVQKMDAIFAAERSINGCPPAARIAARRAEVAPLVNELIEWMKRSILCQSDDILRQGLFTGKPPVA
jgi:coenzyme F420-reducing hydrogenase gamma subunit